VISSRNMSICFVTMALAFWRMAVACGFSQNFFPSCVVLLFGYCPIVFSVSLI
jgi:hypothetical protein